MSRAPDPLDRARLARIQQRFGEFSVEYAALPLYSSICRHVARDDETAALLLAAGPGQARPVLWLAAVHELVLRQPDLPAARWFPSVVGAGHVPSGDPWPDVRGTVLDHADEIVARISTHGTQTNEVNRAVYVAVGLALAARDRPTVPLALVELGASAGLLLGVDRYAVELASANGRVQLGDASSSVRCSGEDRSGVGVHLAARAGPPETVMPPVRSRVGLDLAPVDLEDDDAVRWLEACLWPEVPDRVERFRSARALLRRDPPLVLRGDMVDGLEGAVRHSLERAAGGDVHVIALSSWAMTYLAPERRRDVASVLAALSGEVPDLSWLTAEPPSCAPGIPVPADAVDGGTVLGLRRWRGGRELTPLALGTCHPHGAWIDVDLDDVDLGDVDRRTS